MKSYKTKNMKKNLCIIFISLTCFSSLQSQEKLPIDVNKSSIKWMGELALFFGKHEGFINFKEGYFIKTNDLISGGEFIIDMNSMTNTDIEEQEGKDGLINHLKDPDFFDVKKYPISKLVFTKVEYSNSKNVKIEADLTIKDVTKPIFFYVNFDYKNKEMNTRFKINRKEFNVNYTSKFKDGAISDIIGLEVLVKL